MSINKATLTKIVNGNTEFIYPKTTSDLVQYGFSDDGTEYTVKDILDNLDNTYLKKTDASTNYLQLSGGALSGNITFKGNTDRIITWTTLTGQHTVNMRQFGGYGEDWGILVDNSIYCIALSINASDISESTFAGISAKATADANGNTISTTYLTKTDASNTYLTKTDASGMYLTISNASNTYLTISNASTNYLKKTDISSWAKSSTKPTYTASEVGALASNGNAVSATKATKDGNGNTISTTYLKKTDITQSDVMGTIKVNNVDIEVYDDSEIYAELDSTYLKKTDASSTYLTKTDASNTYLTKTGTAASATSADSATKATQDDSGNTISTTYLKKYTLGQTNTNGNEFTLSASGTYIIITGHNSTTTTNTMWIYRTGSSKAFMIGCGGETCGITITGDALKITVKSTSGSPNVYALYVG